MKIYHYEASSGFYLGEGLADPDPMEEGNWLIPAHATSVEPIEVPEGSLAKFNGTSWEEFIIPEEPVEPEPIPTVDELIRSAPANLFGGPSLKEIFNGY